TAAKGDAFEVAGEVIAPSVVVAGQVLGMAAPLQADEITAMSAAIDHRVDLAVLAAGDDNRSLAEKSRQVIARLRQLSGQDEILQIRPKEDAGKLLVLNLPIRKYPIWDAGIALGRPPEYGPLDLWLHGGVLSRRRKRCRRGLSSRGSPRQGGR